MDVVDLDCAVDDDAAVPDAEAAVDPLETDTGKTPLARAVGMAAATVVDMVVAEEVLEAVCARSRHSVAEKRCLCQLVFPCVSPSASEAQQHTVYGQKCGQSHVIRP